MHDIRGGNLSILISIFIFSSISIPLSDYICVCVCKCVKTYRKIKFQWRAHLHQFAAVRSNAFVVVFCV